LRKLLGAAAILFLAGGCASRDPYEAGGYVVWDEGGYGYGYGYACAVDDWYGSGDSAFPGRARVVPVERARAPRAITRDASAGGSIASASGNGSGGVSGSGPSPIASQPPPIPASAPVSHSAPPPPRAEPHS
jgi:hypothetical protein